MSRNRLKQRERNLQRLGCSYYDDKLLECRLCNGVEAHGKRNFTYHKRPDTKVDDPTAFGIARAGQKLEEFLKVAR
jgi:hypothetical protein